MSGTYITIKKLPVGHLHYSISLPFTLIKLDLDYLSVLTLDIRTLNSEKLVCAKSQILRVESVKLLSHTVYPLSHLLDLGRNELRERTAELKIPRLSPKARGSEKLPA